MPSKPNPPRLAPPAALDDSDDVDPNVQPPKSRKDVFGIDGARSTPDKLHGVNRGWHTSFYREDGQLRNWKVGEEREIQVSHGRPCPFILARLRAKTEFYDKTTGRFRWEAATKANLDKLTDFVNLKLTGSKSQSLSQGVGRSPKSNVEIQIEVINNINSDSVY
jgi:hypothetical protein